jgi:hypothetical protein
MRFDPQARLAEFQQQAEPQASRRLIIDALHSARVVQCFDVNHCYLHS